MRFHHRRAGVVFGSNQLDVLVLADDFGVHGRSEFRVKSVDSVVCRKHRSFSGSEREANV
ncbi:hypothetical protein LHK_00728 [Laribacter hongkongensis HLHK9]|uniref:Uncharacterized protein n=1 Tax=Laribacter hongkongensis (strain HLHK9) TaxID=557598 RepID=C1D4C7_LARHH|nr:hypothetical protein LHK_00728 [Laribacter hongkongensis HLHK9]